MAVTCPGTPITIAKNNYKLTTSMNTTKATKIQIRLLVEDSQQLKGERQERDTHFQPIGYP